MEGHVCIDGELCAPEQARVSVFDRGFLYGDSAFEVLRTYGGKPFCELEHLQRLQTSCARLLITPPAPERWPNDVRRTLAASGLQEAYVRIMVTRGVGPLGIDLASARTPSVLIFALPLSLPPPSFYTEGIAVGLVHAARATDGTAAAGAKTSNYLGSVLALHEVKQRVYSLGSGQEPTLGCQEAIIVGPHGEVVEGATSNIFLVRGRTLITPPMEAGILVGITRNTVMELAAERGLEVLQAQVHPADLYSADEVFITSTIRELCPVVRVDDVSIGNGKPGPLSATLLQAYRERASRA